ncbi:MAG: copper chaperone PCu(A)C [Pseudonocardiaceae bacterium]
MSSQVRGFGYRLAPVGSVPRSSQSLHYGPVCTEALRLPDGPVGYALAMRVPLRVAARTMVCGAAVLALVGCSAGQITQTDTQVAAVNGTYGNLGSTIALRDVLIPYPGTPDGTYPAGSTVPVVLTIINQGDRADELLTVTSPAAGHALVVGTAQIPPGSTVISTAAPSEQTSPLVVGQLRVLLTTTHPLRAGLNTPLTFHFRNAGNLTLPVPMAPPPNAPQSAS